MPVSSPPHDLELVIDFVNTFDAEAGTDALGTPAGVASWLADRGLLTGGAKVVGASERRRAVRLREALRGMMLGHNGLAAEAGNARELELAARKGCLAVHFDSDGSARVQAEAPGFDGALAKLLIPLTQSRHDGSWERVKACRAGDCQWAFYDGSRNCSGVWCEMAVCGNRTKVRAYRSRHARTG